MIPIADAVCVFYRQLWYLPFFFYGYQRNRANLRRVFLVNDEPWTQKERELLDSFRSPDFPSEPLWNLLDHEHTGYGVARSFNQGIAECQTDHVFLTSFDQILPGGIVSELLQKAEERPNQLVFAGVDAIREPATTLGTHKIYDGEHSIDPWAADLDKIGQDTRRKWESVTNACTVIHRRSHLALGGFDERFVEAGRGLEDQEYAARWQAKYGADAIQFIKRCSVQFRRLYPEQPIPDQTAPEALVLLNKTLKRLGFPEKAL